MYAFPLPSCVDMGKAPNDFVGLVQPLVHLHQLVRTLKQQLGYLGVRTGNLNSLQQHAVDQVRFGLGFPAGQ